MFTIIGLEPPYFLTSFIEVTPPTQSYKQATSDILNHPEINSPQNSNDNKSGDQAKNEAEEEIPIIVTEVHDKGSNFEDEGSNTTYWMASG